MGAYVHKDSRLLRVGRCVLPSMFLGSPYLWIAALPCAWAGVTTDTSLAANKTFDYIILGGGTAGLALAGRLSEEAEVSVPVVTSR